MLKLAPEDWSLQEKKKNKKKNYINNRSWEQKAN